MTESGWKTLGPRSEPDDSRDKVRQIGVPPTARALSMLSGVDYADAFLVEVDTLSPPEQCASALLDGAPLSVRANLQLGWAAIGLKPAIGRSAGSILGWRIRVSTPEYVLLGRDSLIGMPGELLLKREGDALLFCTFVQHNNAIARAVWASIQSAHLRIVPDLLEQATRRLA
jgi:hypothetical protein